MEQEEGSNKQRIIVGDPEKVTWKAQMWMEL
jgi:hypothetical protein